MTTDAPTILATSGGLVQDSRIQIRFGPLLHYEIELAGVTGRKPKVCHVGTALGDQRYWNALLDEAARQAGVEISHLNLFPMPNVLDIESFLGEHDAIWVGGGSVANLLALWRLHGVDKAMHKAWKAGVVLGGVSAGSLCWHTGGTTDSFGTDLRPVTNGLGFLPHSNGVHYDAEEQRRPMFHQLLKDKTLTAGYATDNGTGVLYRGTEMVEAVSEVSGRGVFHVSRGEDNGKVAEKRIEPRLLPGAS